MWWDAMRSPAARWNHPKAVEKTVPWKPWKTKPRFPTAPTAPWKTRNLGEFPTFLPPCDSPFPSLKKTKGKEGSMKQADRSSVNKSGQIQKLPTDLRHAYSRPESQGGSEPGDADGRAKSEDEKRGRRRQASCTRSGAVKGYRRNLVNSFTASIQL